MPRSWPRRMEQGGQGGGGGGLHCPGPGWGGRTNKVKTLPSLVLRTRVFKKLNLIKVTTRHTI